MTEFIHQASDDQLALAVCFGAVLVCGLVMHFSHHVGRMTGHIRLHESPEKTGLRIEEVQTAQALLAAQSAAHDRAA